MLGNWLGPVDEDVTALNPPSSDPLRAANCLAIVWFLFRAFQSFSNLFTALQEFKNRAKSAGKLLKASGISP